MDIKEYLDQIKTKDLQIKFYARELEHWQDVSLRVSGSNFEPNYNSSRNTEPVYVKCLEKISELEEVIKTETAGLIALKAEVLVLIHKMRRFEYCSVIMMRYVELKQWQDIAAALNYSLRYTYKIHNEALQELKRIYKGH